MTPRTDFDKDLTHLQDELLLLGGMVEKAVAKAMDALRRRDLEASRQVVKEDDIREITQNIQLVMGDSCRLEWEYVDSIDKSPQGKFLFTRCLIQNAGLQDM